MVSISIGLETVKPPPITDLPALQLFETVVV